MGRRVDTGGLTQWEYAVNQLAYFYHISPREIWDEWTFIDVLKSIEFAVIALDKKDGSEQEPDSKEAALADLVKRFG